MADADNPIEHAEPLTLDGCRALVEGDVFRLRPDDYGAKYPIWPGAVGIEMERLVAQDGANPGQNPTLVPLGSLHHSDPSLSTYLAGLAKRHGWNAAVATPADRGPDAFLLQSVTLEHGDQLTFEPGGQLEFSSAPYPCLNELIRRWDAVEAVLNSDLAECGISLVQLGLNPWYTAEDIGLQMPKRRYRAMDKYFTQIGPYGRMMMRQTCTVQVNLDFGPDEETLAKRYLGGNLVAPLATAIFANSPVVANRSAGLASFRSRIWRGLDGSRTGFPKLNDLTRKLDKRSCVDTFLEYALDANVVFITGLDYRVPERPLTFGQWLATPVDGLRPTLSDFITHLTLLFPEVRPRRFLELRSVDCLPPTWHIVPAAFYTGLLYDPRALDELLDLMLPELPHLQNFLEASPRGLSEPRLAALSRQVMSIAAAGFARLPGCFKGEGLGRRLEIFKEHYTDRARCPADEVVASLQQSSTGVLTLPALRALEEQRQRLL